MPEAVSAKNHTIKGKILVVDDEPEIRESLETLLELENYAVRTAPDGKSGLNQLAARPVDLVLLDLMLPDLSGIDVLEEIRKHDHETPVLILTAYSTVENAVAAIKSGANNFLTKPWNNEQLLVEIDQTIARSRLERENEQLRSQLRERYSFANIIGKSGGMQSVFDLITQVAPSRSTVLIHGESGTGKELIARAIHAHSPRVNEPFVPVVTSSIPEDLIESALFGHVKGAFTSAIASRQGYFGMADGGTLFLDEIGTLGVDTQAKLLRVIQEREFMPVGSNETVHIDVRIVAATNEDLATLVDEERFRKDLYYRLAVIEIKLPPLRERREDIPLLIEHFFNKYCQENERFLDERGRSRLHFAAAALQILMDHTWPGNVRELENVVERAVVLATQPEIQPEVLPESLLSANGIERPRIPVNYKPAAGASLFEMVEEFERQIILEALEKSTWSQTEAAKQLNVALSTLNQKIQRLNIDVKTLRNRPAAD